MKVTSASKQKSAGGSQLVPVDVLYRVVAGFQPEEIGLSKAWEELYYACQAASAKPELLRAIHDIKESIEDAEGGLQ